MTTHPNDLLDRYRRADFTARLHMYLQYPELRNDFIDIDQTALPAADCEPAHRPCRRVGLIGRLAHINWPSLLGMRRSTPRHS